MAYRQPYDDDTERYAGTHDQGPLPYDHHDAFPPHDQYAAVDPYAAAPPAQHDPYARYASPAPPPMAQQPGYHAYAAPTAPSYLGPAHQSAYMPGPFATPGDEPVGHGWNGDLSAHAQMPSYPPQDGHDPDPVPHHDDDIPLLPHNASMPGGFGHGMNGQSLYDEEPNAIHYGRIPQRQPRRYKTVKRVELYHGNLVLDCAVPSTLLAMVPNKTDREMTHVRYTAATCDPNDFKSDQYQLRQVLYEPPRRTELFIVMTMYNEDEVLFTRTMHGVLKNIQHLCQRTRSKTWGADGWKKVVVCVVADGRLKVNSRTLSTLAAHGIYQDGVAKNVVNGKPVTAHIYEYTTQVDIGPDLKPRTENTVPVQVIFCLKEKNQKKINSHRWFFNAFGPVLQPNVCVLLDVGTQPSPHSIYHLWKTFDVNSNVGGACGEIVAGKGKYWRNLINPLVAAQNFEYKMSNILDKPTESVFGYISVLPGAFSAYRYIALQNDVTGHGPLEQYFLGETLHSDAKAGLFTKNMYLAEDRILCWELVAKRDSAWLLHYVKSASAETDVPDTLPELISQRRRWLNGSFFAAIHAVVHFGYLYRSHHGLMRKFWLHIEMLYTSYNMLFAWFSLGNYFIAFEILTKSVADPSFGLAWLKYPNTVLHYVYLGLLVMCFLLAMGNRPQGSNKTYTAAVVFYAFITVYMTFAAVFLAVKGIINVEDAVAADGGKIDVGTIFGNAIFRSIVISLLATYGIYFIASLLFFDPAHMFTSLLQYILFAPSMINVIQTYAFCNTHDLSWGTKGDTKVETDLGVVQGKDNAVDVALPQDEKDINAAYEDAWHVLRTKPPKAKPSVDIEQATKDSYANIRTNVVTLWALTNGALVAAILSTDASANIATSGSSAKVNIYMSFLLYSIAFLAAIRLICSSIYLITWLFQG